ncbi:hypothetical protein BDY19DRAFT_908037 [Irpex rosettiformis]|uniref:Uncharacterized protein n=1 Tax=Irpex rosettiformis TaxID=378272 RepID=A0ACB8TXU7_9APHY|nr:hypothetical protein BDY19DRAFT_908037 [Irpex rosettiformis]
MTVVSSTSERWCLLCFSMGHVVEDNAPSKKTPISGHLPCMEALPFVDGTPFLVRPVRTAAQAQLTDSCRLASSHVNSHQLTWPFPQTIVAQKGRPEFLGMNPPSALLNVRRIGSVVGPAVCCVFFSSTATICSAELLTANSRPLDPCKNTMESLSQASRVLLNGVPREHRQLARTSGNVAQTMNFVRVTSTLTCLVESINQWSERGKLTITRKIKSTSVPAAMASTIYYQLHSSNYGNQPSTSPYFTNRLVRKELLNLEVDEWKRDERLNEQLERRMSLYTPNMAKSQSTYTRRNGRRGEVRSYLVGSMIKNVGVQNKPQFALERDNLLQHFLKGNHGVYSNKVQAQGTFYTLSHSTRLKPVYPGNSVLWKLSVEFIGYPQPGGTLGVSGTETEMRAKGELKNDMR